MPLQVIDIDTPQPNGKRGDPARVMAQKINANDAYLDSRIGSVESAAVPKSGGEDGAMSGRLIIRGAGSAIRRVNLWHNANESADFGGKFTLAYGASTTDLAGVFLVPTGANGFEAQFQVWLKDGDFFNSPYVQMLAVTRTAVTFRGNALWHAGNTTVDANNFIKRA